MKLAQIINLPDGSTITGPLDPARFGSLSDVVTHALPFVYAIAGIILLGFLLMGGFDYLTSMGDPKKAQSGQKKITNALLGFFIIFISYWLVQIIDYLFDLGIY